MKKLLFAGILSATIGMVSTASADIIVQYGTAGSVTNLAPAVESTEVSGDDLIAGPGLTVQTFSTFNFTGWDVASTDFASAVAADDYWSWGFDVTGSLGIDLTTMDIRLDRSGTGPDDVEIQMSVNGGAATTVLTHDYMDTSSGVTFLDVDISAASGLTTGDSVVFTLGAFNSESAAGSFDLETITFPGTDGITINGTVIPEPSTFALLGLGGLVAFLRRRR